MSWTDEEAQTLREGDWAAQMTATHGWTELARWVTEQAQIDADAIERGAASWDEYQRRVGRLEAFRKVLNRPGDVVEEANRVKRGDSE